MASYIMVKYFYIFWYFGSKGRNGSERRPECCNAKRLTFY